MLSLCFQVSSVLKILLYMFRVYYFVSLYTMVNFLLPEGGNLAIHV